MLVVQPEHKVPRDLLDQAVRQEHRDSLVQQVLLAQQALQETVVQREQVAQLEHKDRPVLLVHQVLQA